jgi:hypothetical protein
MTNFRKREVLELGSILFFMFGFSFLLNFLWEAVHAVYLYERHDFGASNYVPMLLYVSSVDGLIVSGLYLGVSVMWLNLFWVKDFMKKQLLVFAFIGVVLAAFIEHLSVFYFHRWAYREIMPAVLALEYLPCFS